MKTAVYTKTYTPPPFNRQEILRYAGVGEEAPEIAAVLDSCMEEIAPQLVYKVCWCELPVEAADSFGPSKDLARRLRGCDTLVVFAATVGMAVDRLIARYGKVSPVKALLFQAIGAERIESLCDAFEEDIRGQKPKAAPRFSPGYGDIPLDVQRRIFQILEPSRSIGVTLNESLLMSPSKSVTAIIGIGGEGCPTGCQSCKKTDCQFRRTV